MHLSVCQIFLATHWCFLRHSAVPAAPISKLILPSCGIHDVVHFYSMNPFQSLCAFAFFPPFFLYLDFSFPFSPLIFFPLYFHFSPIPLPDPDVRAREVVTEGEGLASGVLEHHRPHGHPHLLCWHGAPPPGATAHELRAGHLLRQHHLLVHPAAWHLWGQQVPGPLCNDDRQDGEKRHFIYIRLSVTFCSSNSIFLLSGFSVWTHSVWPVPRVPLHVDYICPILLCRWPSW